MGRPEKYNQKEILDRLKKLEVIVVDLAQRIKDLEKDFTFHKHSR